MLARMYSHAVLGMNTSPVEVETDLGRGLPAFSIVGLPDAAVRESRERVRAGIINSEYDFPLRRITVNLAPADIRKEGPAFDLPIALSLLAASEQLKSNCLREYSAAGELSLDGSIRRISGALAIAEGARRFGHKGTLIPDANAGEAALVEGIEVIAVSNLRQAIDFLSGKLSITPTKVDAVSLLSDARCGHPDLADVKGQQHARRALEICAAGGHNLLMVGAPGSGKTMMARRLPSILPQLSTEEAIEATRIYSVAGLLNGGSPLVTERPFRSPHHTISHAGLVGGGTTPRPGEISLSHQGVLFLDELPEFSRAALETLRQPVEDGEVTISRSLSSATFPARFMLVAAMNPCPCGYLGSRKQCSCPPHKIAAYRSRISGPLLDRIDVATEVPALGKEEIMKESDGEPSAAIAERVSAARERQIHRLREAGEVFCNSQMNPRQTRRYCILGGGAEKLLERAIDQLELSARSYHRLLRVSRTIADLEDAGAIEPAHLAEAVGYRFIDRSSWSGC